MISYSKGNILDLTDYIICIPVNCVGIAGKGLAKECADKYPRWLSHYKRLCELGQIKIGEIYIHTDYGLNNRLNGDPIICSFPTKYDWRDKSKYYEIVKGLETMYFNVAYSSSGAGRLGKIAIPKLGCGEGKLDWDVVKPLIEERASEFRHIDTMIVE